MTEEIISNDLTEEDFKHADKTVQVLMDEDGGIIFIQGYGEEDPRVVVLTFEQAIVMLGSLGKMLSSHLIFPVGKDKPVH